jgi:hypothetical protein
LATFLEIQMADVLWRENAPAETDRTSKTVPACVTALRSRIAPPNVQGSANLQLKSDGQYNRFAEAGSDHRESIFNAAQNKAGDDGEDRGRVSA